MGKVYQFTGGDEDIKTTANTTQFWQLFGMLTKNNTEANCEMIMRTAGTLSVIYTYMLASITSMLQLPLKSERMVLTLLWQYHW